MKIQFQNFQLQEYEINSNATIWNWSVWFYSPFIFYGYFQFEHTCVIDYIFICFISGCEESGVIIESLVYQGTESVKQLQQLFYILLWVLYR